MNHWLLCLQHCFLLQNGNRLLWLLLSQLSLGLERQIGLLDLGLGAHLLIQVLRRDRLLQETPGSRQFGWHLLSLLHRWLWLARSRPVFCPYDGSFV